MTSFAHCGSRVLLMTLMVASLLELVVCITSAPIGCVGTTTTTFAPPVSTATTGTALAATATTGTALAATTGTAAVPTPLPTASPITPSPISTCYEQGPCADGCMMAECITVRRRLQPDSELKCIPAAPCDEAPPCDEVDRARNVEKEQHSGYEVIDSGDEAAEDSLDLVAALGASLAFVAVVVIGVALCYALRRKNGKAEKVSDEMNVEEDVPDATVEMVVEAQSTM